MKKIILVKPRNHGFTLIEVVLVLAIGSLIFLLAFLAFRQVSANRRDTQRRSDVAKMMAQSHCFILNSNYEGLPCVLLEAMSCGIPVITTNVGAIPEIIDYKQGIIIQPNKTNELVKAMEDMISCWVQYNGNKIRANVVEKYSYPAIAKDFDDIFKSVLAS